LPDKFLKTGIIVPINHALHAYIPFQLAVNSSQAQNDFAKITFLYYLNKSID